MLHRMQATRVQYRVLPRLRLRASQGKADGQRPSPACVLVCVLTAFLLAALKCGYQPMGSQDSSGKWGWGNQQCWGDSYTSNPWNECWGSKDGGLWDKVPLLPIPGLHIYTLLTWLRKWTTGPVGPMEWDPDIVIGQAVTLDRLDGRVTLCHTQCMTGVDTQCLIALSTPTGHKKSHSVPLSIATLTVVVIHVTDASSRLNLRKA